jgi:hypothetical protein
MLAQGWNSAWLLLPLRLSSVRRQFVLAYRDALALCAVLAVVFSEASEDHSRCARQGGGAGETNSVGDFPTFHHLPHAFVRPSHKY